MKFADLIKTNSWLSIEMVFLKLYPNEECYIGEYQKVFNELLQLTPIDTDISILVSNEIDEFDNYEHVDVTGYYNDPQKSINDFSKSLALEFTTWDKWLGMDMDKNSLKNFSELELISHCLLEMAFFSFDQEEIEQEFNRISDVIDEVKNLTEEEKKVKYIPFENLLGDNNKKDQN
jgi:hypothetical protein